MTINEIKKEVDFFRQKVGGDIQIFFLSSIFLFYPIVLVPAAFYEIYRGRWIVAGQLLYFSMIMCFFSRAMFLFQHWLKRKLGGKQ